MSDSPGGGYAFWTDPESTFTVTYSLSVFHEIDFFVSEGFRRIPHGGVELGGVLFGRRDESSARVEAFRAIESEHASGPSFVLSERDLEALAGQLVDAKSDPELTDLEPLGWFIAHTRSDLEMNEREIRWFDRFFPGPGKFTVLAKPERFQPTRFVFLIRGVDGRLERDGRDRAIILPLPGRAGGSGNQPAPSLPAPRVEPASPAPNAIPHRPTQKPAVRERSFELPIRQARQEFADEPPAAPERMAPALAGARSARDLEEPPRRPREPMPPFSELPAARPIGSPAADSFAHPGRARASAREQEGRRPAVLRLLIILVIAAALGCAAGYWAYVQLPPANIPLSIQPQGSMLLVSWPPEQTRGAGYATIRIDDAAPLALSASDKAAGHTTIKANSNDVKVELTVQHWMRQSRGIVRFVTAAVPAGAGQLGGR